MAKIPLGHQIGRVFSRIVSPVTYIYSWWKSFELADGTTYFIMPDKLAIFIAALAPAYIVPAVYFDYLMYTIGAVLVSPLLFLSVLRVKDGRVKHARLLLFMPYRIAEIPSDSEFEIYEAWEDPAPSGVAFTFTDEAGEYLHLGTALTASELEKAIGATLKKQGWLPTRKNRFALQRPSESSTDAVVGGSDR